MRLMLKVNALLPLPAMTGATYGYNALGQRISKHVTYPVAEVEKRFVYDENGRLIGEYGDHTRE